MLVLQTVLGFVSSRVKNLSDIDIPDIKKLHLFIISFTSNLLFKGNCCNLTRLLLINKLTLVHSCSQMVQQPR